MYGTCQDGAHDRLHSTMQRPQPEQLACKILNLLWLFTNIPVISKASDSTVSRMDKFDFQTVLAYQFWGTF